MGERGGKRVQLIIRDFDLIKKYYQDKVKYYHIAPCYVAPRSKKYYGFTIFDKKIKLVDMAYRYGSNELSLDEIFNSELVFLKANSGFSNNAKKKIHMELIKQEFPPISKSIRSLLINNTIKGPTIGCRPNIEFSYCSFWDIKSAYPYWITTAEFPYEFVKTSSFKNAPHLIHFGKITIKNFKAKHAHYLPLFLKGGGLEEDDINVLTCNRRILGGEQYSGYGFLELLIPVIKNNYDYESLTFDKEELWVCKTKKLPQESVNAVYGMFDKKEKTKKHSDKLILNRTSYGLFITHKQIDGDKDAADYEVPYQVGIYIVALQAHYVDSVIQKCGVEHLIKTHTDSIGFDYNVEEIVMEENERRKSYKNLGLWEQEDVVKCCYYSNTRAKLLNSKGELTIKHGGICEEDVEVFCYNNSYNEIVGDSEILITKGRTLEVNEKGTFIKAVKVPLKFSEDLEDL